LQNAQITIALFRYEPLEQLYYRRSVKRLIPGNFANEG
jgi:hypothetical protein